MTDPKQRGYYTVYREGETNHCPGCGRSHWHLGRLSAECGFCATAVPYPDAPGLTGTGIITHRNRHIQPAHRGRFIVNGRAA